MPAVLQVAIAVPLAQAFDYLPPLGFDAAQIAPGCRVAVPFGRLQRVGVVIGHAQNSTIDLGKLKRATQLLDTQPLITSELSASLAWAARYYQHPLGEVLESALPVGLRQAKSLPMSGERALIRTPPDAVSPGLPRAGSRATKLLELLQPGPLTFAEIDIQLPNWRGAASNLRKRV